jgi:pseudouridine synthase
LPRRGPPRWLEAARTQNRSPAESFDWLSRALARAGVLPRAEAEVAIAAGRVRLNGKVQRQPLAALRPEDRVELDGRAVSLEARTLAFAWHKPAGLVCAGTDPEGVGTVFDGLRRALPPELRSYEWHAIGRLDRNTTGLLLFTNDERLVEHVTSPKTHLDKRYVAKVSGALTDEKLEPLRRGITLDDGPARPAHARIRAPGVVELALTEGRHHQVKRMLGAVGLPVLELAREAVGGLELDVSVGEGRLLSDEEIEIKLSFPRSARA